MAALEITPALAEIISSLTQEDIPAKLRCTICSRLAVNAYRLPCCDQAICETCHSTLASSCPVCEHSPVSAADCKPNKSLRTTIKVFLRTEEKKREARLKESKKNTPPATPSEPVASPKQAEVQAQISIEESSVPVSTFEVTEATQIPLNDTGIQQLQADQDIPQPSIEEITPGQEPRLDGEANDADGGVHIDSDGHAITEKGGMGQPIVAPSENLTSGLGMGLGSMDMPGGFPGMGFGDMNQMQQMQMMMSMQNGLAPNTFGNFPMMGMPGMNMDPMAMQQMMMSGGFGGAGMGMNGMNMGMGMGGFEGGAGTGFNNGWNNQQSWNVGQDNYNHHNASGIGHGDYGSNNSGYPQATGYNQGNYGRGNHFNNYQNNNGYHGRGGRGRGGYGRGGYGYGSNEAFSQQYPQPAMSGEYDNGTSNETPIVPTGPKAKDVSPDPNVDEFGREKRQVSESETKDVAQVEVPQTPKETPSAKDTTNNSKQAETIGASTDASEMVTANGLNQIPTLDDAQGTFNSSYNSYGQNNYNQNGYHGRGVSFSAIQPPKPVDVPINAPKGPKAMREGLPNTGISGLKARGFGKAVSVPLVNGNASAAPVLAPSVTNNKDRERSRSQTRDRSRSRDRKRSRSRDRHHRRHRHRSTSLVDDKDEDSERRRERRKRHRREDEDELEDADLSEKPVADEKKDERNDEGRSRSASPSDSRRSSHKSRRDREKHRERERDERDRYRDREDDREHKSSHKHRSSRRHHDDRSRSRDRERDREHRHRHSRRGSEDVEDRASKADKSIPPTPIESEAPSRRPSTISSNANGLEIKGASLKRKSTIDEVVIPTGPRGDRTSTRERPRDEPKEREKSSRHHEDDRHRSSRHQQEREKDRVKVVAERPKEKERTKSTVGAIPDPHTIEREARNRERLLKEAQRIAGLAGGRKRSRDDTDIKGGLKKRGRGHENEEARIARLEEERESARWT